MKAKKPKMNKPDEIRVISDDYGNNLTVFNNGKRVKVRLKLVKESKSRSIGVINLERKILEVKRNRTKHLFRKFNAYGFNHKLIADAKLFDKVRLTDNIEEWLIPKQFILDNGKFLNFLNKGGFELQIFIPIDSLNEFKKQPKI